MRIAGVPNSQAAVIMFLTTLSLQQLTHDHACIHACGLPKTADRKTKQNKKTPQNYDCWVFAFILESCGGSKKRNAVALIYRRNVALSWDILNSSLELHPILKSVWLLLACIFGFLSLFIKNMFSLFPYPSLYQSALALDFQLPSYMCDISMATACDVKLNG